MSILSRLDTKRLLLFVLLRQSLLRLAYRFAQLTISRRLSSLYTLILPISSIRLLTERSKN
jgi:hypothetical protein